MKRPALCVLAFLLVLPSPSARGADWPQFRGPDGQGHSDAEGIPLRWSESKSIVWKTAIPGEGWSSPVISGNQIWLTSSRDGGTSLHALCFDRASGQRIHDVEVLKTDDAGPKHVQNGYASPTPVLDGKHVFVHFGARGTVCLNTDGRLVWKNTSLPFEAPQGAASSPILHEGKLILVCDGTDTQFLAALDKRTGAVLWKQLRQHLERVGDKGFFKMSYSTPLVWQVDGVPRLVATSAEHVAAYDINTGKEQWWMPYVGFSMVGRPSFGNGMFYVVGSIAQDHHAVYAIRPGGRGKIGQKQLAWKMSDGIPHVPSPLLVGSELYVVHDKGTATCLDALTGEVVWKQRLGGNFRASPIQVRDRIYFCNQEGKTTVVQAGKEFKVLATSQLDGIFLASPAVAGRALFLRSDTHLYRIEDAEGGRK
ncbi:MAG: PQQ-binding-like beta-propeller repeat protein [Pirellulales bacterium]